MKCKYSVAFQGNLEQLKRFHNDLQKIGYRSFNSRVSPNYDGRYICTNYTDIPNRIGASTEPGYEGANRGTAKRRVLSLNDYQMCLDIASQQQDEEPHVGEIWLFQEPYNDIQKNWFYRITELNGTDCRRIYNLHTNQATFYSCNLANASLWRKATIDEIIKLYKTENKMAKYKLLKETPDSPIGTIFILNDKGEFTREDGKTKETYLNYTWFEAFEDVKVDSYMYYEPSDTLYHVIEVKNDTFITVTDQGKIISVDKGSVVGMEWTPATPEQINQWKAPVINGFRAIVKNNSAVEFGCKTITKNELLSLNNLYSKDLGMTIIFSYEGRTPFTLTKEVVVDLLARLDNAKK
jgi:hypothetical protein